MESQQTLLANGRKTPNVAIMAYLKTKQLQIQALGAIIRHFKNPFLVILLRLGFLKVPYFVYQIRKESRDYKMLARPTSTSHADLFVLREVLVDETYKGVLSFLDKKDIRLVDVGSNLGSFVVWMNSKVGVREAFCFEPEPDSFRLLAFNLSGNGCTSARTFNCALGGTNRTVHIKLKESSPGGTSIYSESLGDAQSGVAAKVLAFEDWLKQVDGEFDLLKLDCEGAEWEIVSRTDVKQMRRFRVCVAEIHGDPESNRPPDEFRKLMEAHGFHTVRWDNISQGLYLGVRNQEK
jgi:FkbM family methyltransferase